MNIFKPSVLFSFLQEHALHAKKGLSQNFLIDGNILRKIIKTANVTPGDLILEIGPGAGALTEQLLAAGARVIAVEKDRRLAQSLQRLQTEEGRLEIIEADILDVPLEALFSKEKGKVVANLPYHITTAILVRLVSMHPLFTSITAMVQKEVGRRCTAQVATPDYSSLTLFLHYYSTPHYAFSVSPSCFYPRPKVDSAIIHLALKQPPTLINSPGDREGDSAPFFRLVRTAFQKRRKMLTSSLRELYAVGKISQALQELEISVQARPEELSLEQFLRFFSLVEKKSGKANTQT